MICKSTVRFLNDLTGIENYEKSIDLKTNIAAYSNLGTIYFFEVKNYEKSKGMYEKAVLMAPNNFTLMGNLADAYRYLEENDKAKEIYEEAIQLAQGEVDVHPNHAMSYAYVSRYYALLGDRKNALENISKARRLAPKNIDVLRNCVKAHELIHQRDKAIQSLKELIDLGGTLSEISKNPDMAELRKDPRYLELAKKQR